MSRSFNKKRYTKQDYLEGDDKYKSKIRQREYVKRNKVKYTEYQRQYQNKRYHQLKQEVQNESN